MFSSTNSNFYYYYDYDYNYDYYYYFHYYYYYYYYYYYFQWSKTSSKKEIAQRYVEDSILGAEIKKLSDFTKFGQYIDLITYFHVKRCKHENCSNCKFAISLTDLYIGNFETQNRIKILQEFCVEYFGHFFSLKILISSLVINGKKRIKLEEAKKELDEEFNCLLSVWNEM